MDGYLEIITGGMYSGKSSELIRRVRRAQYAKKIVQLFKPIIDDRYSKRQIVSHDRHALEADNLEKIEDILTKVRPETDIVAIDELHFFEAEATIRVIESLVEAGKKVIGAGLDMDFAGRPFGAMPYLMAIADEVDKLRAICIRCGGKAYISQRLVNGQPAASTDEQIEVGGVERYEARCRKCWALADRSAAATCGEREAAVTSQPDESTHS
jgi:thymidine kinase